MSKDIALLMFVIAKITLAGAFLESIQKVI